jgi:hypothetical protein
VTVTRTDTRTVTRTQTVTKPLALPLPVAETHAALLAAARSRDYEQLRPLIPDDLSYTFGGPVEGGPIAYWRRLQRESGQSPLAVLERLLALPYTVSGGLYVWPFAFDKQPEQLTAHERGLLGDLADDIVAGTGYVGWRVGITPDGTWRFFVAGD